MRLLNKESIQLFKNLSDINDGFRIPDEAYVHGKDFLCFEQLGGDCYFSNYWYGKKEEIVKFAELLANYFKKKYGKIVPEEDQYDFYGMVVIWYVGDNALVANINLDEKLAFWDTGVPTKLEKAAEKSGLIQILNDGNDNSISDMIFEIDKDLILELLTCVSDSYKDEYINSAKEEGLID